MGEFDDHPIMKQIRARAKNAAAATNTSNTAVSAKPKSKRRWTGSKKDDENTPLEDAATTKEFVRYLTNARLLTAQDRRNRRLVELAMIDEKLRAGKHVQNRTLETWLTEDEFAEIDARWAQQKRSRASSKDKPDALKEYEARLKRAQFFDGKAQGERKQGKLNAAEVSLAACNDELDALMDFAREQIEEDAAFVDWLDRPLPRSDLTPTLDAMPRSITSSSKDSRVQRKRISDIKREVVTEAIAKLMQRD